MPGCAFLVLPVTPSISLSGSVFELGIHIERAAGVSISSCAPQAVGSVIEGAVREAHDRFRVLPDRLFMETMAVFRLSEGDHPI